jgi:transposase
MLGLQSPWRVEDVAMDVERLQVTIRIIRQEGRPLRCPDCGKECPGYDHAQPRRWRHLDAMQFKTILEAEVPRCQCPEHGVRVVDVPWANDRDRFTLLFAAFAIQVLLSCRSVSKAARLLRLDWKGVHRLMEHAVEYGLSERDLSGLRVVAMDEKMVRCKVGYASVLSNVEAGCVIELSPGRRQVDAEACWAGVPAAVAEKVECGVTDMAASYKATLRAMAPNADIVIDKFHVASLVNKAVDQTRRGEQETLADRGGAGLKKSRFLWLGNPNRFTASQERRFEDAFAKAKKTSRAWLLKESLADWWLCTDILSAAAYFKGWFFKAVRSKIKPMVRAARSLRTHLPEILNYFEHRVTNAGAEGLNSLIASLQCSARGYRNFANLRAAVLFYHGGLTLCPISYPF